MLLNQPYKLTLHVLSMKKIASLVIATCLLLPVALVAQKKHPKFGKISDEELSMTVYDKDTSAAAVVLWDIGETSFPYNMNTGFENNYDKFIRIKIFRKEGYEFAKFHFLLRKRDEKLGSFSAATFNMEGGKLVKTKLDKDQFVKETYNKYWDIVKFELPAVKEGSIIDVEYTIMSEWFDIRNWQFQAEIPVVYSEYKVSYPEYFYFKQLEVGYTPITTHQNYTRNGSITVPGGTPYNFRENVLVYTGENMPAFHEEAYIDCADNYIAGIQFELGSFSPPYGMVKNYTQTWEAINRQLMDDSDFGGQLGMALFLNQTADTIKQKYSDPKERLIAGYSYIQKQMAWNNSNGIYTYQGLRTAYNEKKGNAGDINLMLVALLMKLELDANPVILSTRENGKIHPAQLILDQYNYVIASVKLDGQMILLDATDKFAPAGMLPERCLNEKGRLINKGLGDWVTIKPNGSDRESYQVNLKLTAEGEASGSALIKQEEYSAAEMRTVLLHYSDDARFMEDFNKNSLGLVCQLDSITARTKVGEPLVTRVSFESEKTVEMAGDLLMVNPTVLGRIEKNPFKMEERNYPVDYGYPTNYTYMATIEIPDGYIVESMPESKRFSNTDKTAQFVMSAQQMGNKVTVMWKFEVKKALFLPEEYAVLKEFYNQVIDAQSKQIVLKKS